MGRRWRSVETDLGGNSARRYLKFDLVIIDCWITFPYYLSIELENDELELLESLLESKTTHQVICPICLKLPARLMKSHLVACECGFRFPLPSHMSLRDFENSIITCSEFHNMSCDAVPVFQIQPRNEVSEFTLSCEACLVTSVILETQDGTSCMDLQ